MKIYDLLLIFFSRLNFPRNKAKVFQVLVAINYFEHLIVLVIIVSLVMPGNINKHQAISSYRSFTNYLSNFKQNCGSKRKLSLFVEHITVSFLKKIARKFIFQLNFLITMEAYFSFYVNKLLSRFHGSL